MSDMLIGKYGQPHKVEITKVTTGEGVQLDNLVSTWNTENGPMILEAYSTDIDTGSLMITDKSIAAQKRQDQENKRMEEGKNAF
jgi:hypothetical protein